MKFRNGTYAARVRFADTPESGHDGDRLVQTFFTVNDLTAPMADDYAAYDFGYLPNGGWGAKRPTSPARPPGRRTTRPLAGLNQHSEQHTSYAGWHELVVTIDDSAITYYVDGQVFGTHDARFLPERPMSISFNQWLIDLNGQTSTAPRAYDQQVDYVLHVKDQVLTPAEVAAKVAGYRTAGTGFVDEVPASCPWRGGTRAGTVRTAVPGPPKAVPGSCGAGCRRRVPSRRTGGRCRTRPAPPGRWRARCSR